MATKAKALVICTLSMKGNKEAMVERDGSTTSSLNGANIKSVNVAERHFDILLGKGAAIKEKRSGECALPFEQEGCFYNIQSQLTRKLLITDREASSQIQIQWHTYPDYLKGLTCRCNKKASENGFKMFSIQYWGECWGIRDGKEILKSLHSSQDCQNTAYQSPCLKSTSKYCTGTYNTAYIYSVAVPKNPLDGNYAEWSAWSKCSKECGIGAKTRTRACNNPAPMYGGKDCEGAAEESSKCNEQACYPYPNKGCGTVKQVNSIDILNASEPVKFCRPGEFCKRTVTFCRVIYPNTTDSNNDYVINMYMYNHANDRGPGNSVAGIIFNAQDVDNFEFVNIWLHPSEDNPCYSLSSSYYQNGTLQSIRNEVSFVCSRWVIKGGEWAQLSLHVNNAGVKLYGNHYLLGTMTSRLQPVAKGGAIVRNGFRSIVEYSSYRISSPQKSLQG
eukprot:gene7488-8318_t